MVIWSIYIYYNTRQKLRFITSLYMCGNSSWQVKLKSLLCDFFFLGCSSMLKLLASLTVSLNLQKFWTTRLVRREVTHFSDSFGTEDHADETAALFWDTDLLFFFFPLSFSEQFCAQTVPGCCSLYNHKRPCLVYRKGKPPKKQNIKKNPGSKKHDKSHVTKWNQNNHRQF